MNQRTYQVIESFNSSKDYEIRVKKGIARTLSVLKVGDTITSTEFAKKYPQILNPNAKRISNIKHMSDNARVFSLNLDREDKEKIRSVTSRSNDLFSSIGDCGDEYR